MFLNFFARKMYSFMTTFCTKAHLYFFQISDVKVKFSSHLQYVSKVGNNKSENPNEVEVGL